MNTAPYLLPEDRPEFERALNEALRTATDGPGAELLRTMALSAMSAIAACADAEYQTFVSCREAERRSGGPSTMTAGQSTGPSARNGALGAGVTAMASVLLPVLAGTAAVIFLLLGHLLRLLTPEPAVAAPMRGVGWAFAALAVVGAVLAMAGLWITAFRNGAASRRDTPAGGASGADRARAAWRAALLERGIMPFLAEACADPHAGRQAPVSYVPPAGGARPAPRTPSASTERPRPPRLGYSRPAFSSKSSPGPEEKPPG